MVGASNFSLAFMFHVMPKAWHEEVCPVEPTSMVRKTLV